MMYRRLLIALVFIFIFFGNIVSGQEPESSKAWEDKALDLDKLSQELADSTKNMESIPEDAEKDTPEAKKRQNLEKKISLLEELISTIKERAESKKIIENLPALEAELEKRIKSDEALPEAAAPEAPTKEGLSAIEKALTEVREELDLLQEDDRKRDARLDQGAELRTKYEESSTKAKETKELLTEKELESEEPGDKELISLQFENASIQIRLAKEELELQDELEENDKKIGDYWDHLLAYTKQKMSRKEQEFSLYQQALQGLADREKKRKEEELARKEEAAAQAKTEKDRFITRYEAQIARSEMNVANWNSRKTELAKRLKDLEQADTYIKDEQEVLDKQVSSTGSSAATGRKLRNTYQDVQEQRGKLNAMMSEDIEEDLDEQINRQAELEGQLDDLEETWSAELETAKKEVPEAETAGFESKAAGLRTALHDTWKEEADVLGELVKSERKVKDKQLDLEETLDSMEGFLLPRLFWIRDAKPLGLDTLKELEKEGLVIRDWAERVYVDSGDIRSELFRLQSLLRGVVMILLIPAALIFLRRFFRRIIQAKSDKPAKFRLALLALFSASLFPLYLYLASLVIRTLSLPDSLEIVLSNILYIIALASLFLFLGRALFAKGYIADFLFGMDLELAKALRKFMKRVILLWLICLLIPWLLQKEPFLLDAVVRLGRFAFGLALMYPIFSIIRPSSPLGRILQRQLSGNLLGKNFYLVPLGIIMILSFSVVMLFLGYRYGAYRIWLGTSLSITIALGMMGLYRFLINLIMRHRAPLQPVDDGEGEEMSEAEQREITMKRKEQIQRFIRLTAITLTVLLVAVVWGVDKQVLMSLDKVDLYTMTAATGDPIPVSLGNIFLAALTLAAMTVILKNLSSIYDMVIFSYTRFDSGVRYAILTMSRYGLFLLGCIVALSCIHLDLGRLSWLMAAVGFGLGFGMQEIFSNFISGIILLLERPIRVGDIVRVGTVTGRVSRINIRATTVVDFDRMEVVIPNKDFITKDVTNWTLGDTTIRCVIPIGVAYGTDPQEVIDLLMKVAKEDEDVLKEPEPSAFFMAHGASSLDFELRCFVDSPDTRFTLMSKMNIRINRELAARGIEIPFPQRDIHIRSDETKGTDTAGQ